MDKLKAILAAKKQQKADLFAGSKYKKRKELDDANLMRLREEEERERARKKRSTAQVEDAAPANEQEEEAQDERLQMKPREEVIKHLRALREPATLFGEDDVMRWKRLQRAEKELHLEDEVAAPDMANVLLEVQLEEKKKKGKAAGQDKVAERGRNQEDAETGKDETLLAFERAAAQLAEAKSEETMQLEDRLAKSFRRWMQEWEEDLDMRPAEVKEAREGRQATFRFRETQKWMEPMFEKLESRAVNAEVLAGMHMIMQAIKERNYSYAIDIYMKVAIGNSAWPIGVTSVGIHSRSAREKISHSMNVSGQAHVMNDEATRKFLWGVKRLCTFLQRLYPTEPSRAVDFNAVQAAGLGSAGGGDGKVALLEAEAHGETWQNMGLPLAPHFMNEDGGVKVPAKWAHTLREYSERVNGTNGAAAASSASPVKPGSVKAARR